MTDTTYWLALANMPGIGPVTFRALCERFGDPAAVFRAPRRELEQIRGLKCETLDALCDASRVIRPAEQMARQLVGERITVLTSQDGAYPQRLFDLADPPPVLYVLGDITESGAKHFSVSGSSAPSRHGVEIAHAAGREMAEAGWTVVSGYAFGVDTAAHLGALGSGGRTILALPMGIRTFALRPEFERFRGELGLGIVLVSECPPDDGWERYHAVRRDRIIAALGQGLFVVEAGLDNGTMITFRHARRLGRPAYVVKYRRAPASAAGNRVAIREGGMAVESLGSLRRILRADTLPGKAPRARQGELF